MAGSGKRYRIKTVEDMARLVAELPPERAAVFLKELPIAIATQSGLFRAEQKLKKTFWFLRPKARSGGFDWIDDDEGNNTMNVELRWRKKSA